MWPGPAGEVAWGPGMGEDWHQMKESEKKKKKKNTSFMRDQLNILKHIKIIFEFFSHTHILLGNI